MDAEPVVMLFYAECGVEWNCHLETAKKKSSREIDSGHECSATAIVICECRVKGGGGGGGGGGSGAERRGRARGREREREGRG